MTVGVGGRLKGGFLRGSKCNEYITQNRYIGLAEGAPPAAHHFAVEHYEVIGEDHVARIEPDLFILECVGAAVFVGNEEFIVIGKQVYEWGSVLWRCSSLGKPEGLAFYFCRLQL